MAYHVGSLASIINKKSHCESTSNKLFDKIISSENVEVQYKEIPVKRKMRENEEKLLTKRKKFKIDPEDSDDDAPQVSSKPKSINVLNAERRIMEKELKKNVNLLGSEGKIKGLNDKKSINEKNEKRRMKDLSVKERESNPEEDNRTIFVGNLPVAIKVLKLKKLFKKYGEVESARLRCPPVLDPKIPKKVAFIKKEFHPERTNIVGYVRYVSEEDARKALEANGMLFEDHHLRVDLASKDKTHEQKKAVFVGNLHFSAEENDVWKRFETCGPIESIRIIRDSITGVGKGFCYVNFKDLSSVELALQLNGEKFKERPLRISRAVKKVPQKKEMFGSIEGPRKRGARGKRLSKKKKQFHEQRAAPQMVEDIGSAGGNKIKKSKKRVSIRQLIGKDKVKSKEKREEVPDFQGVKGDESSSGKKRKKLSAGELKKKVLAFQLQLKKINCSDG